MKYKIQKLINTCSDCEFAIEYRQANMESEYALICRAEITENDETKVCDSFMLTTANEPIKKRFKISIPNKCPLLDYESNIKNN